MKTIKILCVSSAIMALLCATGFDCPECDFTAQTIALCVSVCVSLVCGLIWAKNE